MSYDSKKRMRYSISITERPKEYGEVFVCGQGSMGQLGLCDKPITERKHATKVTTLERAVDVVAGGMHSLVLTSDGKVYSFGCNDEGALGREGSEFVPLVVSLPAPATQITAGDSHSACLLEDGRVFAWGSFMDSRGTMGLTVDGISPIPILVLKKKKCCAIASGTDHLVMLTNQGDVFTMGWGAHGQLGRLHQHTSSGEIRLTNSDSLFPQKVQIKGGNAIIQIWATRYGTILRSADYKLWAFGLNNFRQLIVPNNELTLLWPTQIKDLQNVKHIDGGLHHTIVLMTDGTCHVIGRSDYGRLGIGETRGEPVVQLQQVTALPNRKIIKVAAGEAQSFALTAEGEMFAWGMGTNHQLGLGTDQDALEPSIVKFEQTRQKRVLQVSCGGQHTLFVAIPYMMNENLESNK